MKTADRLPQGDVRLRATPDVAITIDTLGPPPEVLLVRGRAAVADDALDQRHYYGEEQATASIAGVDVPGTLMARIALRPSWAGFRRGSPAEAPRTSSREDADGHLCPDPRRG